MFTKMTPKDQQISIADIACYNIVHNEGTIRSESSRMHVPHSTLWRWLHAHISGENMVELREAFARNKHNAFQKLRSK